MICMTDSSIEKTLNNYPPTKEGEEFKKYWEMLIYDVVNRKNFKRGNLLQLEILCDLYVQKRDLDEIIEYEGYTIISDGRNGVQEKVRPEVVLRNRIISDIALYSKSLGFQLQKDLETIPPEEETDEWE